MNAAIVERDPIVVNLPLTDGEPQETIDQPNPDVVQIHMSEEQARAFLRLAEFTRGSLHEHTLEIITPWVKMIGPAIHQLAAALKPLELL